MSNVFLSIGSNVGDRKLNLSISIDMLCRLPDTSIVMESSIYETQPLYNANQGYFLNKVIKIRTKLNPHELLKKVKSIEFKMGRNLNERPNFPRIIDIDILVFDNLIVSSDNLILPHPRIEDRLFVLQPWAEIDPEYIMAKSGLTIKYIYENSLCSKVGNQEVRLVKN